MGGAEGRLVSCLPGLPHRFDSGKAEAGAIALLTESGIVLSYNALNGKEDGDPAYPAGWFGLGQALFAAVEPVRLLQRQERPYLRADHEWELHGFAAPAVVANGMVFFRGEWLLYYGAADRCISLAVCRLPA